MFELTSDQEKALKALNSNSNIFFTGDAGTGKTFTLNEFIKQQYAKRKNIMLTASTGIAALNIGGVTCHKALKIPIPAYGNDVSKASINALIGVDTLLIEEISMLRNDVFDYICRVIKRVNKLYKQHTRLIVTGDFYQLPPVVSKTEHSKLKTFGYDLSGYCFTTKAWEDMKFKTVILHQSVRQSDEDFVENLNLLKNGETKCIGYFNQFANRSDTPSASETVHLCPTNAKAAVICREELDKLPGQFMAYTAKYSDTFPKDAPVEENLLLKVGCKVMFVINDTDYDETCEEPAYVNGTIGEVVKLYPEAVDVKTNSGKVIRIGMNTWHTCKYTIKQGVLNKEETGYFSQIPLKVAYAITIHKSQGKTFENAVIDPVSFANGQLYVAISRIKSPEGIYLTSDVLPEYVRADSKVKKFYSDFSYAVSEAQTRKQKETQKAFTAAAKKKKPAKKTNKNITKKKTETRKSTKTRRVVPKTQRTAKTVKNIKRGHYGDNNLLY